MPDENKNPDVGQVQTPAGATDNKEMLEKIAKMKPEEMLDLYVNSQAAIKTATQRNMETADERKRVEAERQYWQDEAKRASEERQRAYDLLTQQNQPGRQPQPTMPNITELTPEAAFKMSWEKSLELERKLDEERKVNAEREKRLRSEIDTTRTAMEYKEFLKNEIYTKYPNVTDRDIDEYFIKNPGLPANPQTVHAAASEKQKAWDGMLEAAVQKRLEEKEKLAAQAQGIPGGAGMGSFKDETPIDKLDEDKEKQALFAMWKKATEQT